MGRFCAPSERSPTVKQKRTYLLIAVLFAMAVLVAALDACTAEPPEEDEITVTIPVTTEAPAVTEAPTTTTAPETEAPTTTTAPETEAPAPTLHETVRAAWLALYAESHIEPYPEHVDWRIAFTCGLLTGDGTAMAEALDVPPAVYACYDGIKIADWSVRMATVDYYGSPRPREFTVLDITVTESNAEALPAGQHALVLDEGLYPTFGPLKTTLTRATYTAAEDYVLDLFAKSAQFGICDFIVGRLDALAGDYNPRTAAEIKEYARTCLDLDITEIDLEWALLPVEGGYTRIGRGVSMPVFSFAGEQTVGNTTVVTVRFWADYSRTVEANVVEYHLEQTPLDWKLIKTVTVSDSGFAVARTST